MIAKFHKVRIEGESSEDRSIFRIYRMAFDKYESDNFSKLPNGIHVPQHAQVVVGVALAFCSIDCTISG